MEPRTYTCH